MSTDIQAISIEILGKVYQVKCPAADIPALKQAAHYLEEKMNMLRDGGAFNLEKVAIITALNVAHQYLTLVGNFEHQKSAHVKSVSERLLDLDHKVDQALIIGKQLELIQPAE